MHSCNSAREVMKTDQGNVSLNLIVSKNKPMYDDDKIKIVQPAIRTEL